MSNRLTITPTKFEDVRTGETSYGWRAYDDYGSDYSNMWDSIPDDDMEFFAKVIEEWDDDYMIESAYCGVHAGLYIGKDWYDRYHLDPVLLASDKWKEMVEDSEDAES